MRNIAALSREIGVPTEASLPHMVSNSLKNIAALCAEIDTATADGMHTASVYCKVRPAGRTGLRITEELSGEAQSSTAC